MRVRFCIALLVVFLGGGAGLRADQITLRNGDRVTGSIVKKDGATLTIASAYFGTVTFPWDQVDMLTTDIPAYVQANGETQIATLTVSGGQVDIMSTTGGTRSVTIGDVATIRSTSEQAAYDRMLDPSWIDLWAGTADLGWAGAAGNAKTKTFTMGVNAMRTTLTDKTSVYFKGVNASALVGGANTSTARAARGGWAYQRDITPRIFGNLFNDYEYDRFQSLDLRFVFGAGGGYHAVKSERTQFDLLAGLNYNRERFSTPLTRDSAEFSWGDDLNRKLNSIVTLVQSYRMFNSLTDTPDFRVNFDLGAQMHLSDWFIWNVNISDRYLHNPPVGNKRNDVLYSTGLGLRFGQP